MRRRERSTPLPGGQTAASRRMSRRRNRAKSRLRIPEPQKASGFSAAADPVQPLDESQESFAGGPQGEQGGKGEDRGAVSVHLIQDLPQQFLQGVRQYGGEVFQHHLPGEGSHGQNGTDQSRQGNEGEKEKIGAGGGVQSQLSLRQLPEKTFRPGPAFSHRPAFLPRQSLHLLSARLAQITVYAILVQNTDPLPKVRKNAILLLTKLPALWYYCCRHFRGPNPCGRSSMAEHQPSKLDTWVRFPSPAPEAGPFYTRQ